MYKQVFGKKLSRNTNSRKALFRSLTVALVKSGKIETTKIKAKAVQGDIEKLFKLVRKDDLASRRMALSKLANDKETVDRLFSLKKLTEKRRSGFTRIVNLPNRKGDAAPMATLEFVDSVKENK